MDVEGEDTTTMGGEECREIDDIELRAAAGVGVADMADEREDWLARTSELLRMHGEELCGSEVVGCARARWHRRPRGCRSLGLHTTTQGSNKHNSADQRGTNRV
jgi:hypothetical protein